MSTQITLTLPDATYRRAEHLAQLTGQSLADVLAETLDISLQTLDSNTQGAMRAMSALSDIEILSLSESQMDAVKDKRLSQLLDRQQAGLITEAERTELGQLMQHYQEGLLRKAQALSEAVRRGLRTPLTP